MYATNVAIYLHRPRQDKICPVIVSFEWQLTNVWARGFIAVWRFQFFSSTRVFGTALFATLTTCNLGAIQTLLLIVLFVIFLFFCPAEFSSLFST